MNIETMAHHYAICALWSSTDDEGEPLDAAHDVYDIAPEALAAMRRDCADFVTQAQALIEETGLTDEQAGHDFWLTRNGHGAGFWDRGLGEAGDKLTAICKRFGESYIYAGDGGLVYLG